MGLAQYSLLSPPAVLSLGSVLFPLRQLALREAGARPGQGGGPGLRAPSNSVHVLMHPCLLGLYLSDRLEFWSLGFRKGRDLTTPSWALGFI